MANSKSRKKSKDNQYQEELQMRIFALMLLFLTIIAVMELGAIGNVLNYFVTYLVGNLYGIIYGILFLNFGYILVKGELPSYSNPRAVGIYLLLLALLTAASLPTDKSLSGMETLQMFFNRSNDIYKGGMIGCLLYAAFSSLFDYTGTVIASFFIGALGTGLLIGKLWLQYFKDNFKFKVLENKKEVIKENEGMISKEPKTNKLIKNKKIKPSKERKPKINANKPILSRKNDSLKKEKQIFFSESNFLDIDESDELDLETPNIIIANRAKEDCYQPVIVSPFNDFEQEKIESIDQNNLFSNDEEQLVDFENDDLSEQIDSNTNEEIIKENLESKEKLMETINEQLIANIKVDLTSDNKKTNHETSMNNKEYILPPISLLKAPLGGQVSKKAAQKSALANAGKLVNVLKEFNVSATVIDIFIGPAVTKFELKLESGTRVNKISQLQDDIKLALAAKDIRIEAPIPGKSVVGVEIPNDESTMVVFKEVLQDIPKEKNDSKLLVPLGKDVTGLSVFAELDKMPHLLIAGATGSGKSVCVNTIICSILMRCKPDEVKLVLVDPKKVELSSYNNVPHLLTPVVTDPKEAAEALKRIVGEMERRYDLLASANVRNITGYNEYAKKYNAENKNQEIENKEVLPFIVVILDEVADLMMVASKDVEECIMRISQMARAAGIHLIVATQRPSTDVITGVVKANIPSRIAFAVSSSIDSRTILDTSGAERLLGKGDMLFSPMGSSSPVRVQGSFVSDEEVSSVAYHTIKQQAVLYDPSFKNLKTISTASNEDEDEEYESCREFVIQEQRASTSLLQRRFKIGYNKAARIIDQLEANGVIGFSNGSKPREVLIRKIEEEY